MKHIWRRRLHRAVKVASEVAEVALQALAVKHPLGIAAVAVRGASAYLESTRPAASEMLTHWPTKVYMDGGLADTLQRLLALHEVSREQLSGDHGAVVVAEVYGQEFAWVVYSSYTDGIWARCKTDVAMRTLGRLLWRQHASNALLVTQKAIGWDIQPEPLDTALHSETANAVWRLQEDFLLQGTRRTVLLYGEPGTGKSHAARRVAQLCGGSWVRLCAQDLNTGRTPITLLRILQPSAVLIDDIDRCVRPMEILDNMDTLRASCRLLIATANDLTKLDPAMLRPERFDDVIKFDCLDDGVLNRMLEGVEPSVAAEVRQMPVAYVESFRRTREVLGDEAAYQAVQQLRDRLAMVRRVAKEEP